MDDHRAGKIRRIYKWEKHFSGAVRELRLHVEETLLQCERFAWLAEEIRDEVAKGSVQKWEETLFNPESRTSLRERAIIALALSGKPEAGIILDAWEPEEYPIRLRLLWQVAKVEWENRAKSQELIEEDDDHDDAA